MYKYPPLTVRGCLDPTVGPATVVGMFLVSILIPVVGQTWSLRWVGSLDCANYLWVGCWERSNYN